LTAKALQPIPMRYPLRSVCDCSAEVQEQHRIGLFQSGQRLAQRLQVSGLGGILQRPNRGAEPADKL
jgi:hypothetical protein